MGIRAVAIQVVAHVDPNELVLDSISNDVVEFSLGSSVVDSRSHDLGMWTVKLGLEVLETSSPFVRELGKLVFELLEVD